MAMNSKWVVLVVAVILVTLPSLGHCRKELGSPGRKTRRNKASVTNNEEEQVTAEPVTLQNGTSGDFEASEPAKNLTDPTSMSDQGEVEAIEGVEDEEEVVVDTLTTSLSTLQTQATEPSIFSWLYGRIMYAIESYSKSDSLWSWITGLGGSEADDISTMALAESRLYDLKFSPLAYEIIDFLEPFGFKPYPDPYEPLYLDKDDIWKFAINWLITFGILSTMCKYECREDGMEN